MNRITPRAKVRGTTQPSVAWASDSGGLAIGSEGYGSGAPGRGIGISTAAGSGAQLITR
jgi:hypothetical protein